MSDQNEQRAEQVPATATQDVFRIAQAENEGLRAQLKLAFRQASMAEVANGALHNVANVLNTVNVSVTLVLNHLRQSRLGNLGKAMALLREHRQDLSSFLADDPKGKMLPAYLETLSDHLAAEQAELLKEVQNLAKDIEHIKEIVTVQQTYARQCGTTQTLQITDLIEDALRMNWGAFERHSITIKREFEPVPVVTVDKHKVLQILINLMRNAKYAMDAQGPPEKILVLSVSASAEGAVMVRVQDNGIGIARENLERVFQHGFTTKDGGHGFGLHSGLLAAREMGCQLTAHSAGPGKGATFCLEIPPAEKIAAPMGYALAH